MTMMTMDDDVIDNQNTTKSADHTPVLRKKHVTIQGLDCQPRSKTHSKLVRSKIMDTLDVPSSNESLSNLTSEIVDGAQTGALEDSGDGVMPCDERRRGLASRSFRANWQIMSASFNSDAPERYFDLKESTMSHSTWKNLRIQVL